MWFLIGLILGILATVPFIALAARKTALRVRLLERRARAAERVAEQVTLTGGLAHEIKNPLSTIGLNLQLLTESVREAKLDPQLHRRLTSRLESLSKETDRLKGILEDFLSFAGRIRLDVQPTGINQVVEELIDFYAPQAEASGVQLWPKLDPQAGEAVLDPTLLKQALLNLLLNACQAMVHARYGDKPHGGAGHLIVQTEGLPDEVRIHVIDVGPGMDEATLERIFHPYFTTKKGGTGLGLPTTRRIIEEHGGSIQVHSEEGRGTDFTIALPRGGPASAGDGGKS